MANLPNGDVRGKADAKNLIKKLYGVPNERGAVDWLEEIPDHLKGTAQSPDHALVVRYKEARSASGTSKKVLNLVSINVQSPYLKDLVRRVFRTYPGVTVDEEDLSFDAPFYSFFNRWATFVDACEKESDVGRREQIQTLLDVLDDDLGDSINDARNLAKNGNITFGLLWTLFPPGCPLFSTWKGKEHLFLVNKVEYLMAEVVPTLALEMITLDHDGQKFGWHKAATFIQATAGNMKISGLPVIPLYFYEGAPESLETLQTRGSLAVDIVRQSPVYRAYDGAIRLHRNIDMEEVEVFVEGRLIVDPKAHSQQASRYAPAVFTIPHKLECLLARDSSTKIVTGAENSDQGLLSIMDNLNQHPVLRVGQHRLGALHGTSQNNQGLLRHHRWTEILLGIRPESFCRSVVRGYCLASKAWAEFEVDNIEDIRWNKNAFDALVIPPARKRLLEALVKQQQNHKTDADVDDIVAGKGQGLIMLLAGPPGTGKTLTAESIADRLQLPLYAVSASELGDRAQEIENQFGQVLRLAASWNAVLLIDEADAFLEKRLDNSEARDRNKRVAAFLRILEYYKGILILTTNRRVNFDDAFYSRIHLTLPFKPLDVESRKGIWRNFVRGAKISEEDLAVFAKEELNGRQIKNIMKMSRLLAVNEDEPLQSTHVRDVLAVAREDFEGAGDA